MNIGGNIDSDRQFSVLAQAVDRKMLFGHQLEHAIDVFGRCLLNPRVHVSGPA